jgi:MFS family permease
MRDDPKVRGELLTKIEVRRASIRAFLGKVRPRRNRLANISIISSAVAAVLVAGPAIGGQTFTQSVQDALSLEKGSIVWRTLCFGALIVSLVAVISTNMSKSQDLAARVTAAEACNTELEGLLTVLQFEQLSVHDAVELYQQYVTKIPFVEETPQFNS